jgi:hypothetical protein
VGLRRPSLHAYESSQLSLILEYFDPKTAVHTAGFLEHLMENAGGALRTVHLQAKRQHNGHLHSMVSMLSSIRPDIGHGQGRIELASAMAKRSDFHDGDDPTPEATVDQMASGRRQGTG